MRDGSIHAISFRDVIEAYMALSGRREWAWSDARGRVSATGSLAPAGVRVLRDIAAWPLVYWRHARRVDALARESEALPRPRVGASPPRALFLRTDHGFNITSGGSVGHLQGVIDGLRALGRPTHVVSTDHLAGVPDDDNFHLCEPQYGVGRNLPDLPELVYNDQLAEFVAARWEQWNPSFVYQRYSKGNYAGVVLRARYGVPYVCEYNGSFPWMARHWGSGKIFHEALVERIELLNMRASDVVVAVSQPMKDELVERGIEPDKILVNPNGVDPERYAPDVDGSGVRARYGLEGKIVVGFIGTFSPWHGAEVLAEAFGRLLNRIPEYRGRVSLLMIGSGGTLSLVQEALARHGAEADSVLTGRVSQEQGPSYLAACDILVSPHTPNLDGTPFFGSPTKLFEYMAMGKGIVASELDQIGELLDHGRTAWLVPPADADALLDGIKRLIDDADLRHGLGESARAEVLARFTWTAHTRRILDKLEERCG